MAYEKDKRDHKNSKIKHPPKKADGKGAKHYNGGGKGSSGKDGDAKKKTPFAKRDKSGAGRKNPAAFTAKAKSFIEFNPEKRVEFLTGFSKRKKDRRVFGLAMGELKKRKDHLEARKETRDSRLEEVEKVEERNRLDRGEEGLLPTAPVAAVEEEDDDEEEEEEHDEGNISSNNVLHFANETTSQMFGGDVSVSISYGFDGDDDNATSTSEKTTNKFILQTSSASSEMMESGLTMSYDDDDDLLKSRQSGKKKFDTDQHKAGNVTTFMKKVSKTLGKKKDKKGWSGKGTHGASGMKGVKSDQMKSVQKLLTKVEGKGGSKGGSGTGSGGDGGGRKGTKGNRIQGGKGMRRK
jgi:ribosomal RNA-processing protein 17